MDLAWNAQELPAALGQGFIFSSDCFCRALLCLALFFGRCRRRPADLLDRRL
jgi:hypothetical protein